MYHVPRDFIYYTCKLLNVLIIQLSNYVLSNIIFIDKKWHAIITIQHHSLSLHKAGLLKTRWRALGPAAVVQYV